MQGRFVHKEERPGYFRIPVPARSQSTLAVRRKFGCKRILEAVEDLLRNIRWGSRLSHFKTGHP